MPEIDLDRKVLVVEDTDGMRRIIKSVLKDFGYKDIREASNGKEGLAQVKSGGFGLVIADWNMPEMTGIEMLRAIRADPSLSDLPVVMLTARKEEIHKQEAENVGVSGYVVKPFTQKSLSDTLQKIFGCQPLQRPVF